MVRFPALGTTAVVVLTDSSGLQRGQAAVEEVVSTFDRACSRFRDDSELSRLNSAGGARIRVSAVLLEAVSAAVRAARLTDGAVDPTVGRAMVALGYDRDFGSIGSDAGSVVSIAPVAGWRTVEIDPDAGTVRLAPGVALDLGATAKALAADRAAGAAGQAVGCGALVSLGGDIATAGAAPADGWRIRVTDDHRSGTESPGQWITIRSGGLATSSTTVRRWQTASGPAHHLVDPTTGQPADGIWRTVSVAAVTCLDANIASTAAVILGERAVSWLESRGLPSRLVGTDSSVHHLRGWPAEGDDLT